MRINEVYLQKTPLYKWTCWWLSSIYTCMCVMKPIRRKSNDDKQKILIYIGILDCSKSGRHKCIWNYEHYTICPTSIYASFYSKLSSGIADAAVILTQQEYLFFVTCYDPQSRMDPIIVIVCWKSHDDSDNDCKRANLNVVNFISR